MNKFSQCPGCFSPVIRTSYGIKRHLQVSNRCTNAMADIGYNEDGHTLVILTTAEKQQVALRRGLAY